MVLATSSLPFGAVSSEGIFSLLGMCVLTGAKGVLPGTLELGLCVRRSPVWLVVLFSPPPTPQP